MDTLIEAASRPPGDRVTRNALVKTAVQATRLLSLVFVVLAARAIGPEEFGKFTFAYALATILGAVLDLGMHSLLVRGVARAPGDTAAQWAAAVTLKLALLGPVGATYALVPLLTGRPSDTTAAVWLLGAAIALQSFIELPVAVFTGFERLEFELGLRLLEKLVLLGIGLAGLALGGGLRTVAGAFALAAAASLAAGVLLVDRRFARLSWRWHAAGARALARALGPVALAFVLAFATTRLVPLLVALLAGDRAAGYFGAAIRVLDVVGVAPVSVVAAVYPVLARTPSADPRFRRLAARSVEMLLALGLLVALGLVYGAEWFVRVVYGPRYAEAGPLLAILGPAACLNFLTYLLGFVFLALDRPGRLVALATASLLTSVALAPPLVLAAGAAGGAVALVAVEAVALAGALVGLFPLVGLPCGRGALTTVGLAAGAAGAAWLLPPGPGRLPVALLVYGTGLLLVGPLPARAWGRVLGAGLARGRPGPRRP